MPGQLKSRVDSPKVSFFMSDFFLGGVGSEIVFSHPNIYYIA